MSHHMSTHRLDFGIPNMNTLMKTHESIFYDTIHRHLTQTFFIELKRIFNATISTFIETNFHSRDLFTHQFNKNYTYPQVLFLKHYFFKQVVLKSKYKLVTDLNFFEDDNDTSSSENSCKNNDNKQACIVCFRLHYIFFKTSCCNNHPICCQCISTFYNMKQEQCPMCRNKCFYSECCLFINSKIYQKI